MSEKEEKQSEKQASAEDVAETSGDESAKDSAEKSDKASDEACAEESGKASAQKSAAQSGQQMKWYVITAYAGYEDKTVVMLKERIKHEKLEHMFGEILVPTEKVIELVKGQKRTTNRRFFPGYILVQMVFNEKTWHVINKLPRVSGFVGKANKPPSISEKEVEKIRGRMVEGAVKPRPKIVFEEGESVRVIDGPFTNFNGIVEEVKPEKGKLRVLVSIFGRATPLELDFIQVEKN